MILKPEDLVDQTRYRLILSVSYYDLIPFILRYLKNVTFVTILFWTLCIVFLIIAISFRVFLENSINTMFHALMGFILLPVLIIPFHEALHIIPYYLSGARNIRMGMDLKQYIFYVTAHRHVATPAQFIFVALMPFILINLTVIVLIIVLPGPWKWSLAAFLFVHATMCAGDAALLNFYFVNRHKKIYTWDDADEKMAYFYEKIDKKDGVKG